MTDLWKAAKIDTEGEDISEKSIGVKKGNERILQRRYEITDMETQQALGATNKVKLKVKNWNREV